MEKARSHERREDTSLSKEEVREGVVMCNEVMINIASREEAMIQGLCVHHIDPKTQRPTGQSPGLGGSTLFPSSRFCPKRVFLGEVFNEGVLQGSKLDLGSPRVKLEGEC
ncbi:hypothetical protein N665_0882s0003 [Sinapis alba]|nr:hypothetical protein N665_1326s0001 [Sinapis alba]KAF8081499.1 hypothetical protein N665_0882s0003 [Sinapis alba]